MEEWRPVSGYEGLYEASNQGKVRSLDRIVKDKNGNRTRHLKGRVLTDVCGTNGYHFISLHKNEKRWERRTAHRLIMETFDPRPNQKELIVDHINGIRADNRLENLRWTDFHTNNRNTPYIRYLQGLLRDNNITYIGEEDWK